ncbi:rCG29372 [Rattus norvegicus]|uniref:RCG29372 n=1 Tax=Rattus norvegicus TaxID=10116 RepID=A6K8K2_RAT|nr:rCG29372 [Rattus norvegicus]
MDDAHLEEDLEDKDTEFTWEVKANDRAYHKQFRKKGFLCWRQKKYKAGSFCLSLLSAGMAGKCYQGLPPFLNGTVMSLLTKSLNFASFPGS